MASTQIKSITANLTRVNSNPLQASCDGILGLIEMYYIDNCILQHPFIRDVKDTQPVIDLYREAKAEVVETLDDLPEDSDGSFVSLDYCLNLICAL